MNLDELGSFASPLSTSPSSEHHTQHQQLPSQSSKSPSRAPSISSDSEWVSPFTVLPPLPQLRKNRGQSSLLRSPEERLHQRSTSSAYYAAAWGSPYATPSPNRSPPPTRSGKRNRDWEISSPLSSKDTLDTPDTAISQILSHRRRIRSTNPDFSRRRASSWDRQKVLSERFNWLSESEHSGSEADYIFGKTPTKETYLKNLKGGTIELPEELSRRKHQARESTATITPDTFHDITASPITGLSSALHNMSTDQASIEDPGTPSTGHPADKPLPNLPLHSTIDTTIEAAATNTPSPVSPSRPRMASMQSFQRPKKKVPWKGRTCVIALPLTDREEAGLLPLLTGDEVKQRMQQWIGDGYDISGFTLAGSENTTPAFSGQSRALYPDPAEMYAERKNGKLLVHIPNQAEWDAWVDYLKEEKLRALGVTSSNSEAPQSTQSPFSSTLSRVSSHYPGLAASPPIGTLSANSNSVRNPGNTFSPPLSHHGAMSSQGGSHIASPLGGMQGPMHGYKQSMAYSNSRMASPFDFPVSQPSPYGPNMRQTPTGFGMRQFSPSHGYSPSMANLQSLGQILSPMMPPVPTVPSNDGGRNTLANPSMEQIRQQQQRQQQIHAQVLQGQRNQQQQHQQPQQQPSQHHQRQQSMFPPQPPKSADLPRTPGSGLESPTRVIPEIMHPTPRSHRHNLSAALQKGIDDAEAARSGQSSTVHEERTNDLRSEKSHDGSGENDDHDQEELPVLKRPETLADVDEKSDIETNPSIAASPLLMDDEKNPFSNLDSLKDILKSQTQTHKPKPSLSRFNVDAPAFDPTKGFSFTPTIAARPAFVPSHQSNPSIISIAKSQHTSKNPSLSKFNVEAPTFMPSFLKETSSQSTAVTPVKKPAASSQSPFTFGSSPAFNVDAPEFKPGQSFSFSAPEFKPGQPFGFGAANSVPTEPRHASSGSIFGNVVVDPTTKVNRRGNRVVSVTKPQSREASPAEVTDEDEYGRVNAPVDRQKRVRRIDSDGDQAPRFADSAPFDHTEGLSAKVETIAEEQVDEDAQNEPTLPVPGGEGTSQGEIVEQKQPESSQILKEPLQFNSEPEELENGTQQRDSQEPSNLEEPPMLDDRQDTLVTETDDTAVAINVESTTMRTEQPHVNATEIGSVATGEQATDPIVTKDTDFDTTRITSEDKAVESSEIAHNSPEPVSEEQKSVERTAEIESPRRSPIDGHKSKFSLSALATPFEFRPSPAPSTEEPSKIEVHESIKAPEQQKKPSGLTASKFAMSPPQQSTSALQASRYAAPPAQPSRPVAGLQASKFAPQSVEESHPLTVENVAVPAQKSPEASQTEKVNQDSVKQDPPLESVTAPELTSEPLDTRLEASSETTKTLEQSIQEEQHYEESRSETEKSVVDETMPSYEEIDAVMKQFEDNPDLGVERDDTPMKSTPLIDMRLPPNFRSDAPSPSPRRLQQGFRELSPQRRAMDFGLGIHKLNDSNGEVSDWANDYSPQQEQRIMTRAGFFDEHVNELVDGLLENRLGPLERSLSTIQHSLALIVTKPKGQNRRSMSTDVRESDADDEDDYDAYEGFSSYRPRSPGKRDRRVDTIRSAIADVMSAYQPPSAEQSTLDMSEVRAALDEMRQLAHQVQQPQPQSQSDLKSMIEEVITSQAQSKQSVASGEQEIAQQKLKLKIEALESSVKAAENRAEEETKLRIQAESDMKIMTDRFMEAQEKARKHHEAHEEAQTNLAAFLEEQAAYREVEASLEAAEELNKEYRLSKVHLEEQLDLERTRNQDLVHALRMIRVQHSDQMEASRALKEQIERTQHRMHVAMQDATHDEVEWRKKEHELIVQNQKMQAALEHEVRHRQKAELELDELDKEHKDNMRFKAMHEHGLNENARLHAEIAQLRSENKTHQDSAFKFERELTHAQESTDTEIAKHTARMQAELDAANNLRSDYESQMDRLKTRLENAEIDLEDHRAKHDTDMAEVADAHSQAVQDLNEKRESALQEQHESHQTKLNDLRERHSRALHNSSDDRQRLEYHLNEKLSVSEDKVKHLEGKVSDLEERLEITKSAARAAVEAATAKGVNLPTPAPSVVASPPSRTASASISLARGTGLPEKISPQALRESIMVLQDQLQNREQKIEKLEQELGSVDKDAPAKIRERDSEITMLREILAVRVDDLEEIIVTLSKPDFDRDAAKDAAIRLKATLQMEQQLKERAAAISNLTGNLPSISTITNLAQSPRGLPMAAAAAWGNWRKARDSSISALSSIAGNLSEQTPSKSRSASSSTYMAGVMTPPGTSQRTPSTSNANPLSPPSMRPLAIVTTSRKNSAPVGPAPRPLRSYSSQPRTLSSQQSERRNETHDGSSPEVGQASSHTHPESPSTPTLPSKSTSSVKSLDFEDDIDEDASPFDADEHVGDSDNDQHVNDNPSTDHESR